MKRKEPTSLSEETESLKSTVERLNRRCQAAEKAALQNVEECRKKGVSLGRGLANWAGTKFRRDLEEANRKIRDLRESLKIFGRVYCARTCMEGTHEATCNDIQAVLERTKEVG